MEVVEQVRLAQLAEPQQEGVVASQLIIILVLQILEEEVRTAELLREQAEAD